MPLWKSGQDNSRYNKWRKEYRKKMAKNNKCINCYRPLVEDLGLIECCNCRERRAENKFLQRNMF